MLTCRKVCNCVQPSLDGVSDHFKRKFRIAAFRLCNIYGLWSNYACFNVYSFFGAYFLLLSFYCHFLPARNKRKIELIPKEKEENLLAQKNREFSIILLVYIFTVTLVYVVLSKGWQP